MWWGGTRHEDDSVNPTTFCYGAGAQKVPVMDRVKATAEVQPTDAAHSHSVVDGLSPQAADR